MKRLGQAMLACLVLAMIALAIWTPFRAANAVDNRTYMEMIAGVRAHGLPYLDNALVDRIPAPEFNIAAHGKLWGEYPPLFPYLAAPALAIGGLSWVYKEVVLLVLVVALLTHVLASRLSSHPLAGPIAAVMTAIGTPLYMGSFQTLAMPLAIALILACVLAAIRALSDRRWMIVTGLAAGLAINAHLMALSMVVLIAITSCFVHARAATESRVRVFVRTGGAFALGSAGPLLALAMLNHYRFGSPNPISYGPCRWLSCKLILGGSLTAGMVEIVWPAALFSIVVGCIAFVVRRTRWQLVVLACASFVAMLAIPLVRESLGAMLATLFGYFIDSSPIHFAQLRKAADGFGWERDGHVVKGLVQAAPVLLLSVLARPSLEGEGAKRALVWAPVIGLCLTLAPFARFPGAFALGWPYLVPRYAVFAVPFLVVLATSKAIETKLEIQHAVVFFALTALGLLYFLREHYDLEAARCVILLRVTLAVAILAVVATALRARWAGFAIAAAASMSIAISIGVDSYNCIDNARYFDHRMSRMERITPDRFALIGWGREMNPILTLRAERDVQYVDLFEIENWEDVRALLAHWKREGRPVFAALPPWPDPRWPFSPEEVPLDLVDPEEGYWRLR